MADNNDKPLVMRGGTDVRIYTLEGGIKLFRTDPNDLTFLAGVLIDSAGREMAISVTESTILVIVPMEGFGGWPYDPMWSVDQVTGQLSRVTDGSGRLTFSQRNLLAKSEIVDVVHTVMEAERSAIAKPTDREIRTLVLP